MCLEIKIHIWTWILLFGYEYGYLSQERCFRLAQNSVILFAGVRFTILLFVLLELKFEGSVRKSLSDIKQHLKNKS